MTPEGLEPGTKIGRYEIIGDLARGGMARVYHARLDLGRSFYKEVAIKLIHPHLARDQAFVAMFLDEARVASRLSHSNICSVQDFGTHDGAPFLVMEYLRGESLSAVLRVGWESGDMPLELPCRMLAEVARGLHAAHELRDEQGIHLDLVHRDICPQNIVVLYDGAVKIVDFGIARARGRLVETRSGEIRGHIAYMAPEQVFSKPLDKRVDVWGMGVVLWEATVGARLFLGPMDVDTTYNVVNADIPTPRSRSEDYPEALESVVLGALQRNLEERTLTAAAFAEGLEAYLYGTGRPFGAAQVAEWMSRHFPSDDRAGG